ncbi:MAG: fructose-6-phosphate aldolase [Flammeovirgaceae bacterium]|nr:fructose-6-phosphate aldolase [Flammeovirgaceae bacterium]|tara:strand:- start:927 stop:1133 length:207 start_codon:yes stop_codon:yes gene_type:complete
MYIIKIKGKAKIPDYIQLRNDDMILVDYFRADRPLDKLKKYGITSNDNKIIDYVNNLEFGKLQKLVLS